MQILRGFLRKLTDQKKQLKIKALSDSNCYLEDKTFTQTSEDRKKTLEHINQQMFAKEINNLTLSSQTQKMSDLIAKQVAKK